MRSLMVALLCPLLLLGRAVADEEPVAPLTPSQAADAVLTAVKAGDDDALKAVAERDRPDPWLVADELGLRGEHAAATAFAEAAGRKAVGTLATYVASRRSAPPEAEIRTVLADVIAKVQSKEWALVVALSERIEGTADTVSRVRLAYAHGAALANLRRHAEGTDHLMRSAAAAEALGWLAQASRTYREVALRCARRGAWPTVLHAWRMRLPVTVSQGDQPGTAHCLTNMSGACNALGRFAPALEHAKRAIPVFEELGDKTGMRRALGNMGIALRNLRRLDEAMQAFERCLALIEGTTDQRALARTIGDIAIVHDMRGEYTQALASHERALATFEALQDAGGEARSHVGIAQAQVGLLAYEEALTHHMKALETFERLRSARGTTITLGNLGGLYRRMGEYEKALDTYGRAVKLQEARADRYGVAQSLYGMGHVYSDSGDHAKALDASRRALATYRTLGNKLQVANALQALGGIHNAMGGRAAALEALHEALEMMRALRNERGTAGVLNNLATVHRDLGEYEKALEAHRQSLAIREGLGDPASVAMALNNIANVYMDMGEYESSMQRHERALGLREEIGNERDIAESLHNIAVVLERLGQFKKALGIYERVLTMREAMQDRLGTISTLVGIGNASANLGGEPRSLAANERALGLLDDTPSLEFRARAHSGLAGVHTRQESWDLAIQHSRAAVAAVQGLVGGLAEEQGASAHGVWTFIFDQGVMAALGARSAAALAYFLESGRAGTLRESLQARETLRGVLIPADLRAAEAKARAAEVRAVDALRRAVQTRRIPDIRTAKTGLASVRGDLAEVVARVQRTAKAGASIAYPEADSLDSMQAQMRKGEALVLYGLTETEGMALIIRGGGSRIVPLAAPKAILDACDGLLLTEEPYVDEAAIEALRKLVVEPLKLAKDVEQVLISPVGRLGYVPFSLLLPEKNVAYVPSGTTYGILVQERGKHATGILAFGDPDYRATRNAKARAVHRGSAITNLGQLPATRAEVEAIADISVLGAETTEEGVAKAIGQRDRWRAVHFACHGLIDPDRPLLSSLALTASTENDGLLTCLEVFRMSILADLVVLSACETGKGKIYKAEGIVGLTRAFMFAGAPRVICSLWKVDDKATQALMIKFYELWNPKDGRKGLGAAAALRKAQEYIRSHEKWKHPYYWAAWVLWGLPE